MSIKKEETANISNIKEQVNSIIDVLVNETETRDRNLKAQTRFLTKVKDIIENQIDGIDEDISVSEVRSAGVGIATDIIDLIEGDGTKRNPGYYLIPKGTNDRSDVLADLRTSISDGLSAMFENIND